MNESNKDQGVHKHRTSIPLDNPEIRKESDWWDEMCQRAGEHNYWSKANRKIPKKNK